MFNDQWKITENGLEYGGFYLIERDRVTRDQLVGWLWHLREKAWHREDLECQFITCYVDILLAKGESVYLGEQWTINHKNEFKL